MSILSDSMNSDSSMESPPYHSDVHVVTDFHSDSMHPSLSDIQADHDVHCGDDLSNRRDDINTQENSSQWPPPSQHSTLCISVCSPSTLHLNVTHSFIQLLLDLSKIFSKVFIWFYRKYLRSSILQWSFLFFISYYLSTYILFVAHFSFQLESIKDV